MDPNPQKKKKSSNNYFKVLKSCVNVVYSFRFISLPRLRSKLSIKRLIIPQLFLMSKKEVTIPSHILSAQEVFCNMLYKIGRDLLDIR